MSAIFRVFVLTSCLVIFLILQHHGASTNPLDTTEAPREERISVRKCKEYKDLRRENVGFAALLVKPRIIKSGNHICESTIGLIINGEKAKLGEYPHMAIIGYRKESSDEINFSCGGSLISEKFVLTVAHCKIKGSGMTSRCVVRLGIVKIHDVNAKDYSVEKFSRHPQYNNKLNQNDIALIELEGSVSFIAPKIIAPACLWRSHEIGHSTAVATGWGRTVYYSNVMSDDLMGVRLDILDPSSCTQLTLSESQICSGNLTGNYDTCNGDSGGPLQVADSEIPCLSHIVGLTSYGDRVCGAERSPGVYTRVSSYLDWIEEKVWGH